MRLIPHGELLSLEELSRVIGIMTELGIRGIRFTGGEPLVRKNLVQLIRETAQRKEIEEIAITTNGCLLSDQLDELCDVGVTAINISLDTTDPAVFQAITGTVTASASNDSASASTTLKSPQTGDDTPLPLMLTLLGVSGAGVLMQCLRLKKLRKHNR